MKVIVCTLNAKYIHTCLALRYLKAYAAPEFDVEMQEYTIKDPALHVVADLYAKEPDVIGFSCYIWNIEETIPIIQMLKKVRPELKIILGGPEVSYDVEYWLERIPEADFIVIGEGEATFKELLKEISGEENYPSVLGIAYRRDGKPVINPPRPKLDLNTIPSPFRFKEDLPHLAKRVVYVETSRGCPFNCQFCLSSIEVGVRYFDVERMKEELLFLVEHGARLIKFVDRTFNIRRDYALEIFKFLIEHHQGCVFQFEITADIMRPEVLQFLNEHAPPGIFRFEIGVQSTNELTNQLVQRKQNFEKLSRTVRLIKEGGKITQHLDLIAGLPEEDYASFRKTFNDVFSLEPEELQLGFLKMLRGTGVRKRAKEHDYVFMDQAPYEVLSNNVLSFNEIIRLKRVEDILEKYWNDHRMDTTIRFLIKEVFPSAFDFFQEFGDYWAEQGWARIGHQLEDLFRRLAQFLQERNTPKLHIIDSLMKYDYLIHHKHKPRTTWWKFSLTASQHRRYIAAMSRLLTEGKLQLKGNQPREELSEQIIQKHALIERIPFDLHNYLETGQIKERETLLVAYYPPKEQKAYTMSVPLDVLETWREQD